jgi:ceramide glucosyltransferase
VTVGVLVRRPQTTSDLEVNDVEGNVLIVRPCCGLEPNLYRTLVSLRDATLPPRCRIVMAAHELDDPALPVMHEAARDLCARGLHASVRVHKVSAPNRKAELLHRVIDSDGRDADFVINLDSNVLLEGVDLGHLVGPFSDAKVGATWCPHIEVGPRNLGNRTGAAILRGSMHSFAVLGRLDPTGLVGKAFAVRVSALRSEANFVNLARFLGEDMALARALRQNGFTVTYVPHMVTTLVGLRSWTAIVQKHARWMRVIRSQRPALLFSYPLLFFPTVLFLPLVLTVSHPVQVLAAFIVLRLTLVATARALSSGMRMDQVLPDWLLGEFALAVSFAVACSTRSFQWRGTRLRIASDGQLQLAPKR